MHLQVHGVQGLSAFGFQGVIQQLLFDQGRVVLADVEVFDHAFEVAIGQPRGCLAAFVEHTGLAGGKAGKVFQRQVYQAAAGRGVGAGHDKGAPHLRAFDDDLDVVHLKMGTLSMGLNAVLQLLPGVGADWRNAVVEQPAMVMAVQFGQVHQQAAVKGYVEVRSISQPRWNTLMDVADIGQFVIAQLFNARQDAGDDRAWLTIVCAARRIGVDQSANHPDLHGDQGTGLVVEIVCRGFVQPPVQGQVWVGAGQCGG